MAEGLESPEQILSRIVQQVQWNTLDSLSETTRGWFHISPTPQTTLTLPEIDISPTPQMVQQTTTTRSLSAIDQAPSDQRLVAHCDRRSTNTPNNADSRRVYSRDGFDERNDGANIDMGERGAPSTPEPDVRCAENTPRSATRPEEQPPPHSSHNEEPETPDVQMADICAENPEGDRTCAEEQTNSVTGVPGQPPPQPFNSLDNQNSDNIDFEMADNSAPNPSPTNTINSADHVRRSGTEHRLVTVAEDPPTVHSHSKPKAGNSKTGNSRKRRRRSPPTSAEEVREEDGEDKALLTPGNDYNNPIDIDALVGMFPMKLEQPVS